MHTYVFFYKYFRKCCRIRENPLIFKFQWVSVLSCLFLNCGYFSVVFLMLDTDLWISKFRMQSEQLR